MFFCIIIIWAHESLYEVGHENHFASMAMNHIAKMTVCAKDRVEEQQN